MNIILLLKEVITKRNLISKLYGVESWDFFLYI